ncbi:MAG: exonuclease SbcCD subunit D [Candidatus Nanohalobium sp.]
MKIVHTADVHLSPGKPERLEALKQVLDICRNEEADLLLITGDLFDGNIDVDDLKTDLRPLFSDNNFHTLVIPGNHDKSAFRQEEHFGDSIEVIQERPYGRKSFDDINIIAVPYTEKDFSELVEPISEATVEGKENLLMIHCTLTGSQGGFGEESKYLPVEPKELVRTGFDHVLAGHIHTSATKKKFGDTLFAYSGSPVSISRSETGKREAWILEIGEGLRTVELDSFHYLKKSMEMLPGHEKEVEEEVIEDFREKDIGNASLIVEISGFTKRPVEEFLNELENKLEVLGPEEFDLTGSGLESVSSIADSKIYQEFQDRLAEKSFENPELVEEKFLRGLSRYER